MPETNSDSTAPTAAAPDQRGAALPRPAHAFKEWALVCDSIVRGETSLIFRKGGLAEGREGFRFRFDRFFLYPTFFHAQAERLRLTPPEEFTETNPVVIRGFLHVELSSFITDLASLRVLDPLHRLAGEVLQERFRYDNPPGLYVAFFRAFRLVEPWKVPFQPEFGGCRSWIELPPAPAELPAEPVLDDSEHERRASLVREVLGPAEE